MELPPISITSPVIDSATIKNAIQEHLGSVCVKDIDSVYISDTMMTHFVTFNKSPVTNNMKNFVKELGGCVPIKYKHHTFIAISNMYDI